MRVLAVCCRSVSPPVEWRRRYGDGGAPPIELVGGGSVLVGG